jgi:hypothetical protein
MAEEHLFDNGGPRPTDAEYRDWCRAEASRLRKAADTAETIEVRVGMLELAEELERRAASCAETPT